MTAIFTSDPMLNFLGIKELCKLRGLSKETKEVIDRHLETKQTFRADFTQWSLQHEKCLEHLPALTNLTVVVSADRLIDAKKILKPTLKSLTLELKCHIQNKRDGFHLEGYLIKVFKDFLRDIKAAIEAGTLELEEFHITIHKKVVICEEYQTHHVSDYDEDGPIYDTEYIEIETDTFDPIHYWIYSNRWENEEEDSQQITGLVLGLLAANKSKWKKITYPYDFFGAANICEVFPQTLTTNWLEESYATIDEHIQKKLDNKYKEKNCYCC